MCRDKDLNTPPHFVAHSGCKDIIKFLTLEMHCDPTSRNGNSATALHLAVVEGHLDPIFFISDHNCDLNIPGQYSRTPLHCAAELGHLHIVNF